MIYFLVIIFFATLASVLTTLLEQYLVFTSDAFIELEEDIEKLNEHREKIEKKKGDAEQKKKEKKVKQLERQLKSVDADLKDKQMRMTWTRMKGFFFNGVVMIITFGYIRSIFDGVVVAKLPFQPFSLLQKASRRNLPGNDPTDCCYVLIYGLASMSIKIIIQKAFGIEHAAQGGFLDYWKKEMEKMAENE